MRIKLTAQKIGKCGGANFGRPAGPVEFLNVIIETKMAKNAIACTMAVLLCYSLERKGDGFN